MKQEIGKLQPSWDFTDFDCFIEYTISDVQVIKNVTSDPDWPAAIKDQDDWVDTTKAFYPVPAGDWGGREHAKVTGAYIRHPQTLVYLVASIYDIRMERSRFTAEFPPLSITRPQIPVALQQYRLLV
jgi:hypothetical protein